MTGSCLSLIALCTFAKTSYNSEPREAKVMSKPGIGDFNDSTVWQTTTSASRGNPTLSANCLFVLRDDQMYQVSIKNKNDMCHDFLYMLPACRSCPNVQVKMGKPCTNALANLQVDPGLRVPLPMPKPAGHKRGQHWLARLVSRKYSGSYVQRGSCRIASNDRSAGLYKFQHFLETCSSHVR